VYSPSGWSSSVTGGRSDQKSLFPVLEASGEVFCRMEQAAGQTVNEQVYNKDTSHPTPPRKIANKPKKF